jgi:hypothetical protein
MKLEEKNLDNPQKPQFNIAAVSGSGFTRLELGEAWMWCSDCMSKLYSFDGTEDSARKCPHPSKCEDDRQRTKRHYR